MKKIFILLVIALSFVESANAQSKHEKKSNEIIILFDSIKSNFTETEDGIKMVKVIEMPNSNKDKIYVAALEALSNIYKDSKEVIQSKDKETGTIFGSGIFTGSDMSGWGVLTESKCEHAIKIEIKDSKCRISIQADFIENTIKNGMNGQTISVNKYRVKAFFPFWKECPMKNRTSSFENVWFCYANSMQIIDAFEENIKKIDIDANEDW